MSVIRVTRILVLWLLINFFLAPDIFWFISITPIILAIGVFYILPLSFTDYWILDKKGIYFLNYSKPLLKKLKLLFVCLINEKNSLHFNSYGELEDLQLVYIKVLRLSPVDISPDKFFFRITTVSKETYDLRFPQSFLPFIPQALSYIEKKGIQIIDTHNLVSAIIHDENLFAYMHKNDNK